MSELNWVPADKQTAAWKIFHKRFHCRVKYVDMLSDKHINWYGMPSIGDPGIDGMMANQLIDRMLTINEMVEFFRSGVVIRLVKPANSKVIYELIKEHLNNWKVHLETNYSTREPPLDDLMLMDDFVRIIHKHAERHFTKEYLDSPFFKRASGALGISRSSFMEEPTEEKPKSEGFVSMASTFRKYQFNIRNNRRNS